MASITTDVASIPATKSNRKERRKTSVLALLQKPRAELDLTETTEHAPAVAMSTADLGLDSFPPVPVQMELADEADRRANGLDLPVAEVSGLIDPYHQVPAVEAAADEGDEFAYVAPASGHRRIAKEEAYEAPSFETAVASPEAPVSVLQAAPEFSRPAKAHRFSFPKPGLLALVTAELTFWFRRGQAVVSRVDWVALGTVATIPTMLALVYYFGAMNALSLIVAAVAIGATLFVVGSELVSVCLFGQRFAVLRCLFSATLLGLIWVTLVMATGAAHQILVASLVAALIAPRLIKNW